MYKYLFFISKSVKKEDNVVSILNNSVPFEVELELL